MSAVAPSPTHNTTNMDSTTATTTAPATPHNAPGSAPATNTSLTFNDSLNAADRYWKFKFALKTIIIITGLIGIGCFAWLMTTSSYNGFSYYGYDAIWSLWPSLITWTVSIIWCLICIAVFILRKRPVHPSVRVAIDLLLWLGFIVTALFAVVSVIDTMSYGTYNQLSSSSSGGDYVYEASNNTWVWQVDTSYVTTVRSCNSTSSTYSSYEPSFKDCAEQDAYVNKLWHEKPHRVNVNLTGVVCQFFGLVLHFVLFVWACVDTNRYNRTKVSKDAEKLAAGIVQTMIKEGAIMPPPGQAYMRPQQGQGMYYQLPPQQQQQAYPMAMMYPQQMQGQYQSMTSGPATNMPGPAAQGPATGVPGPSNEKGVGPRYA